MTDKEKSRLPLRERAYLIAAERVPQQALESGAVRFVMRARGIINELLNSTRLSTFSEEHPWE
jgi:hypothetical protein